MKLQPNNKITVITTICKYKSPKKAIFLDHLMNLLLFGFWQGW